MREPFEQPVGKSGQVAAGAENAVDEDDGRGLARARGEVAELSLVFSGREREGERGGGGRK